PGTALPSRPPRRPPLPIAATGYQARLSTLTRRIVASSRERAGAIVRPSQIDGPQQAPSPTLASRAAARSTVGPR
ncbi:hypothetical protein, partial [Micromonospora globispora]|uniref:hypothetical protein n=1 Tax=Micromonospora globispora TaxID=1450148 RepID=UPI001A9C47A5